jgi:MFS family permease
MLSGISLTALSLLLASRLHVGASYGQVVIDLVLLGAGTGISLVSLTSASLAGVEPRHAGAASGLVNVTQQIGAAVGLAVLVTVFGDETNHAQLGAHVASAVAGGVQSTLVHGLDDVFRLAAVFALMALVLVAVMVRPEPRRVPAPRPAGDPRPVVATRTVDLAARSAGAPVAVALSAEAATACSQPSRPI